MATLHCIMLVFADTLRLFELSWSAAQIRTVHQKMAKLP